jgi:hypothetical protein
MGRTGSYGKECKAWNVGKIREVEHGRRADFEISNLMIKVKEKEKDALSRVCFAVSCFCGSCHLLNLVQRPSHCRLP